VALYLAVTTASALNILTWEFSPLLFGAVATMVIASSLHRRGILERMFSTAPLLDLGRISYSFYLLHWIVLKMLALTLKEYGSALGPVECTVVLFALGLLAAVLMATGSWWLAERPYFIWTKARGLKRASARSV
jgi:exopolysaccharide production protein ExoZ